MKKIIQILIIILLLTIISLIFVFVLNPLNLRTKIIGSIINSYLSNTIENYESITPINNNEIKIEENTETSLGTKITNENDKHPLLTEEQEKTLESFGVNVEQLPNTITEEMEICFIEKLGQERANEIVAGASPNAIEIFKARECLGK